MAIRFVLPICFPANGTRRLLCALSVVFTIAALAPIAEDAWAKAPPLATVLLDADALAAPDSDAAPVAVVRQGAEVELTGEAAPGFPGVYYDGQAVWVPMQYHSLGVRPGIDTGSTIAGTTLLDAHVQNASVPKVSLPGQAVILTVTRVDGYDAASHDGAGGWIDERDVSR